MTPVVSLPQVSTTPAKNLSPVSTTLAANFATSFFFFNYLLELRALLHFRDFFTKHMVQKYIDKDDIWLDILISSK
jgi:hypothetical protein